LEEVITGLLARGAVQHPELSVKREAFVAHLARCGAPLSRAPDQIHAEDLFLACVALAGDGAAVGKLRRDYDPVIVGYTRHISGPTGSIEDVAQVVWAALLVGEPAKAPKLFSYSGIGPLAGFIGVTAQRIALKGIQRQEAAAHVAERASAESNVAGGDAELEFMKQRYRSEFEHAVRAALDQLGDRDRMILRMRVVEGLTIDRIARAYRVGKATMWRWIDCVRQRVLEEIRRGLRQQIQLSDSQFQAFIALFTSASALDLSISNILAVHA
jgi:RNA polymerase sigma-70 factor (ECF subfamily)